MGIELERVKINRCRTVKKFNHFFLTAFNLYTKKTTFRKTTTPKASRKIDSNFAGCNAEIFNEPSCNLPGACGTVLIPVSSSLKRINKRLKKMVLTEKENIVFSTFKVFEALFSALLTFSLSFFKQTYPQNWKTIFVHLLEKSNLLVRSDNNTELSSPKILQTTTI